MQGGRIFSIDIFRGLTIFLMVFVNEVAGVQGIPAWLKHVPPDANGMTFVDVVFPGFLYIVGMAIPFSVANRLQKDPNEWRFWQHVFKRTLALLILGVFMVNSGEMDTNANLIPAYIWKPTIYVAAMLIWNRYPRTEIRSQQRLYSTLRILGALLFIGLYLTFRKEQNGQLTGMTPSWWGILGLIGWAYLLAMVIYRLAKGKLWVLISLFVVLWALILLIWAGWEIPFLSHQRGHLAHTLIVLSGIIGSLLVYQLDLPDKPVQKVSRLFIWSVALFMAGYISYTFGGISKVKATASWSLYSGGFCGLVYVLTYWLVEVWNQRNWASFLQPAGENPLLTYIIPPFFYGLVGFGIYPDGLGEGWPGLLRCLAFTLAVLWLVRLLTKNGVKLQL